MEVLYFKPWILNSDISAIVRPSVLRRDNSRLLDEENFQFPIVEWCEFEFRLSLLLIIVPWSNGPLQYLKLESLPLVDYTVAGQQFKISPWLAISIVPAFVHTR
jgi:hypothetical protein